MCYRALSLRYACIRSSGIIHILQATFVPNIVFFAASIAELAHGEKSRTNQSINQSINQSLSLYDAPGTQALALRKKQLIKLKLNLYIF